MKIKLQITILPLALAIIAILFSSCEKEIQDHGQTTTSTQAIEGTRCNPYSLRVMQAALDSLLSISTKTGEFVGRILLEPTDYYVRVSSVDTAAIVSLKRSNVEVFDYPLDCEFEDDTDYCFNPQEFTESELSWNYLALPSEYAVEEIPYDSVLEAEMSGTFIKADFDIEENRISCDLLDECYVPEHANITKSGQSLPVDPEALEAMAYKIAGVSGSEVETKASASRPAGYVYVKNGLANLPVKGVKIRVQKFLKWKTVYTNESGYFCVSENFSKPNISIIYNNTKDFTVWGNWAFLAPATFTKQSCTTASSFRQYFDSGKDLYSPWSWSVVNNAAYDYYRECSSGLLLGVSTPPSNMKIWCMNINWNGVGGGAPMIKHLITSRVLSGASAVYRYMAGLGWGSVVSLVAAAAINIMGPDILIVTHNQTYNTLYATTFHELSHSSHFKSIGEWNYGKLIWYEMTHGDATNLYGTGGTGVDGEGYCEVSETYAFSIENYIRKKQLHDSRYDVGTTSSYFFHKYVSTLSSLLINGTLTPGQIYSCMSSDGQDMSSVMTSLCNKYPSKKNDIQAEMTKKGL